ncbi:MAG: HAD family hydrolase [Clostridia bacterium]|nr:HAD family hydrolase [Clostridia bacterium]
MAEYKDMKKYKYLIFDADHTLIDYKADEKAAFARLFAAAGLTADERALERCHYLSEKTWTEVGLYDVTSEYIRREYHNLYKSHVVLLFTRIFAEYPMPYTAEEAGERFLKELEGVAKPIDGAIETLEALSKRYILLIATNGLNAIQTGRLKELRGFFHRVFISEALQTIKPHADFFERIKKELSAETDELLMIGDSLTSDIAGAMGAGIDCCWYNPTEKPNDSGLCPDFEIKNLRELIDLL